MIAPEIAAQTAAIRALARRYDVRRLSLFGSAATCNFDAARGEVDFLADLPKLLPAVFTDALAILENWYEN